MLNQSALLFIGLIAVTAFARFSEAPMSGALKTLTPILWLGFVPALGCLAYLAWASARWALRLDDLGIEQVDGERRVWRVEWSDVRRATIGEPQNEVPRALGTMALPFKALPRLETEVRMLMLQGDGWTRSILLHAPLWGEMPSADVLLGEVRRHGFVIDGTE